MYRTQRQLIDDKAKAESTRELSVAQLPQANQGVHGASEYYSEGEKINADNCRKVRPVGPARVRKRFADEIADADGYVIEGRITPRGAKNVEEGYWPGKAQEEDRERSAAIAAQMRAEAAANR
jgi:hypothetical protein